MRLAIAPMQRNGKLRRERLDQLRGVVGARSVSRKAHIKTSEDHVVFYLSYIIKYLKSGGYSQTSQDDI